MHPGKCIGAQPRGRLPLTKKERTLGQEERPPPMPPPMHANALLPTALRPTPDCTPPDPIPK